MKDLYTFDSSKESALQTYKTVRNAYVAFFEEFKIPYLTAEASSGEIGGDLSHEYHLPSLKGEDKIITCTSCSYVANEELAGIDQPRVRATSAGLSSLAAEKLSSVSEKSQDPVINGCLEWVGKYSVWRGISENRLVLYEVIFPSEVEYMDGSELSWRRTEVNRHALKQYVDDLDLSVEYPKGIWSSMQNTHDAPRTRHSEKSPTICRLYDYRLPQTFIDDYEAREELASPGELKLLNMNTQFPPFDLVKLHPGDRCPKCDTGKVQVHNAVELGHTFHLGTRYSEPLQATFTPDPSRQVDVNTHSLDGRSENPSLKLPPTSFLEMGCHGIGVSRMIAAIAESLCDSKGLNWPRVMAPFEAVIVPTSGLDADAAAVYDLLVHNSKSNESTTNPGIDAILDDRNKVFAWKISDADLIGYPIIVVLGRKWRTDRACQVQCRRLNGWKEIVPEEKLREVLQGLLERL